MPESSSGRALLAVLAVPAALVVAVLASDDGALLPQSWSGEFYVVKGLTALAAVLLVLFHMARTWPFVGSTAQRLRYLSVPVGVRVAGGVGGAVG
jgi:hypothetical protein